jgi:hypothetical protein
MVLEERDAAVTFADKYGIPETSSEKFRRFRGFFWSSPASPAVVAEAGGEGLRRF